MCPAEDEEAEDEEPVRKGCILETMLGVRRPDGTCSLGSNAWPGHREAQGGERTRCQVGKWQMLRFVLIMDDFLFFQQGKAQGKKRGGRGVLGAAPRYWDRVRGQKRGHFWKVSWHSSLQGGQVISERKDSYGEVVPRDKRMKMPVKSCTKDMDSLGVGGMGTKLSKEGQQARRRYAIIKFSCLYYFNVKNN